MTFNASMNKKCPIVANKPKENIRKRSKKVGEFQKKYINGNDKPVPVNAVNRSVVWLLSEEFKNLVEIVKKAKHNAAIKGKITA